MPLTLSGNGTVSGVNTDIGMRIVTPTSVSGGSLNTGGSVTFSSSSGVQINGCFSSLYDNYRVYFTGTQTSAAYISMSLTNGGNINSVSYYWQRNIVITSGTSIINGTANTTSWNIGSASTVTGQCIIDISEPYINGKTSGFSAYTSLTAASLPEMGTFGLLHDVAYQADGFKIIPTSGTISGKIRVYGYNNG